MTEHRKNELAPCGIYCGACPDFSIRCGGCADEDQLPLRKSKINCRIRKCVFEEHQMNYCLDCEQYPCGKITQRIYRAVLKSSTETAYRRSVEKVYPKMKNLGVEPYAEYQNKVWTCPQCGGRIFFTVQHCSECGYESGLRTETGEFEYRFRELETDRLILRALTEDDSEAVFDYASDNLNTQYMSWPTHQNIGETKEFLSGAVELYRNGTHYDWALTLKENGRMIGTSGITNLNPDDKTAEIGYILHPDFHRKGLAYEAAGAVLEFVFNDLKLKAVHGFCMPENRASSMLLEKLGFFYQGRAQYQMIKLKNPEEVCFYRINKEDFFE